MNKNETLKPGDVVFVVACRKLKGDRVNYMKEDNVQTGEIHIVSCFDETYAGKREPNVDLEGKCYAHSVNNFIKIGEL